MNGCVGHRVIVLTDDLSHLPQVRWLAGLMGNARTVLKTPSYDSRLHSALAGDGMACLPRFHADGLSGLTRIDKIPAPAPVVDLWLALHKDNRNVRRIKAVIQYITDAVSGHLNQ
jgi:DNA-binding transcriptional LysR family regulator